MFLLVLAYPGSPGPKAVKRLCVFNLHLLVNLQYGESVDNTVENSSVFSLIRMRRLPSQIGSKTWHQHNPSILNWRCRLRLTCIMAIKCDYYWLTVQMKSLPQYTVQVDT